MFRFEEKVHVAEISPGFSEVTTTCKDHVVV